MTDEAMPVRLSHLLRHCSVGAVVRGPDHLVTVKDTTFWKGSDEQGIRHVERVRRALKIDKALRTPPKAKVENNGRVSGHAIPAMRFPAWTRCSRCGLLHHLPWRRARTDRTETRGEVQIDPSRCSGPAPHHRMGGDDPVCGGKLEQVPWVLAHEHGYLADVPWHALAHHEPRRAASRACPADWKSPYLQIQPAEWGYRVLCTRCRASGPIASRFPYFGHEWQQPWLRKPPEERPEGLAWILEIGDVRVHSPETRTALVIPPESRIRKGTVVDRLYSSTDRKEEIRDCRTELQRRTTLGRIAAEWGCGIDEVEEALEEIEGGYPLYGKSAGDGDLLGSEYRALIGEIPDLHEDEDFVTEHHTRAWSDLGGKLQGTAARLIAAVDRLIAVNRLKEILVLDGFRRLEGRMTPPDLAGMADWLPALELYGEGIFFTLRESFMRRWEADRQVRDRARIFLDRFNGSGIRSPMGPPTVSPRFLLLHTLAHLMIRELETKAGYPAASLRERIYCQNGGAVDSGSMAGVLIYVAVPDTEGSLGGLMSQAEPSRFIRLLSSAVEAAEWCSLDPVCARQEGHGPGLLNRAACHACALLPETSCAFGNVLLDRAFVTEVAGGITGLFDIVEGPEQRG
ncbi:MAG: DUF1998 domain-containing protein [Acidobacteriota bacterium]|nr:DUF1998 domain-containing protein [Acidobacteriota bacterium]